MINVFIDSHTHLDFRHYKDDQQQVIQRALSRDIEAMINVGADLPSSKASLSLARRYSEIYATVGVHPHEASGVDGEVLKGLRELAECDEVVAIGETGLDFHYDNSPREVQERVFRVHIRMARKLKLPLVVHSREADEKTLQILKEEQAEEVGGVIHCFSGPAALAEKYTQLNFYLGLGGVITFPQAREIREAIPSLSLSSLLLETDAPYLTPVPHRGKRNEPSYVTHVASELSSLMGVLLEEVAERTTNNVRNLFNLL